MRTEVQSCHGRAAHRVGPNGFRITRGGLRRIDFRRHFGIEDRADPTRAPADGFIAGAGHAGDLDAGRSRPRCSSGSRPAAPTNASWWKSMPTRPRRAIVDTMRSSCRRAAPAGGSRPRVERTTNIRPELVGDAAAATRRDRPLIAAAQPLGARPLEELEVVGIEHDAAGVGVLVRRPGRGERRTCGKRVVGGDVQIGSSSAATSCETRRRSEPRTSTWKSMPRARSVARIQRSCRRRKSSDARVPSCTNAKSGAQTRVRSYGPPRPLPRATASTRAKPVEAVPERRQRRRVDEDAGDVPAAMAASSSATWRIAMRPQVVVARCGRPAPPTASGRIRPRRARR